MDRKYVLTAFGYAILGVILGIVMAASKNHTQLATHAHIMLLGFVTSFIYAVSYKLWIKQDASSGIVRFQFLTHQVGTAGLAIGFYLMFAQIAPAAINGALIGISSLLILISFVLMKILFIKNKND